MAAAASSLACSVWVSFDFLAMSISRDMAAYSRGVLISPSRPSHFFTLSRSMPSRVSTWRRSRSLVSSLAFWSS